MNDFNNIAETVNTSRVLQENNKIRRSKKEEAHRKGSWNSIFNKFSQEEKEKYLLLFLNKDNYTSQECEKFWDFFQGFVELQKNHSTDCDLSYLIFPHDQNNILQKIIHKSDLSFNFNYCIFNAEVYLSGIKIKQKINFEHTVFKKSVNFKYSTFYKDAIFSDIYFKENTYFSASAFIYMVDFQNSKCEKIFDFSDVAFSLLNLDKSYFPHASYLRLSGWDKNTHEDIARERLASKHFQTKETARIIKAHFEKQNNITESNIYYPIEMEMYRDEIAYVDINSLLNFFLNKNYFVTTVSKYVSNFGTNWVKVLGWIILFSITILIIHDGFPSNKETLLNMPNRAMELINPLNVFKKDYNLYDGHEFLAMIVRIITVYLFWQFTMAFRQNTRRK